jgi:NRAMP (natural resistance-associated macrophage protein)-like metal ion transporter
MGIDAGGKRLGQDHGNGPQAHRNRLKSGWRKQLGLLGPGLITGASDDDPSGIATYSQVGAVFGYGLLWALALSVPLVIAIQQISARIGRVTGKGIAGNLRAHYPRPILHGLVFLMVLANLINLGADLAMMGDSVRLIIGAGRTQVYVAGFAFGTVLLEVFVSYKRYERWLKWLTLALLAYVLTAFVVRVQWGEALRSTLIPTFDFKPESITALVALLGTTISPYMFFWQSAQEVQDQEVSPHEQPLVRAPGQAPDQLERIDLDTRTGMAFASLTAWFIILTSAATLHSHGITDIQTSTQAAAALRPLAGPLAFYLFAAGMIGTGLLAVPLLAGSAAYAAGEALRFPVGLQFKAWEAKRFYGVLLGATLLGALEAFLGINPMKALYASAVINGIVAGPLMIFMLLMATDANIMGSFTLPPMLRVTGWIATGVMILGAVGLLAALR